MSGPIYFLLAVALTITILLFAPWIAFRKIKDKDQIPLIQIGTFFFVIMGFAAIIVFFPMEWMPLTKDQLAKNVDWDIKEALLGFLGVIVSAAIALSASSMLGNVFAGFMIRSLRSVKTGHLVRINNYFGAITERGLLHLEIETDSGELITLPNLYVISSPLEVLPGKEERRSIEVSVALPYAVHRSNVARLLKEAAKRAGLKYPMVFIEGLGNSSVNYQTKAFIPRKSDTLRVVARSKFLAMILDIFHEHKLEVLSPEVAVQREAVRAVHIPEGSPAPPPTSELTTQPEKLLYEKANSAKDKEELEERLLDIKDLIKSVKMTYDHAYGDEKRANLKSRLEKLHAMRQDMEKQIKSY